MKYFARLLVARFLAALLLAALLPAHALSEPRAEVRLAAFRVVTVATPSGVRETLEPLKTLRPGDVVEYEATYVNGTGATAHDVQLSVPVPQGGLEYIAAQKSPRANSASVDGQHFAALPLKREETIAGGARVQRDVPLAEYRVLRWSLGDLPAGATRSGRARMQLPGLASGSTAASSATAPTAAAAR